MNNAGQPDERGPADAGRPTGEPRSLLSCPFTAEMISELRHMLAAQVAAAGLSGDTAADFVLAIHELVTNAVRHGGGAGNLHLLRQGDVLVCEVVDHGNGADDLPVRLPAANLPGGRGLWLAHQLAGSLMVARRADGVTATVTVCLTPENSTAGHQSAGRELDVRRHDPDQR